MSGQEEPGRQSLRAPALCVAPGLRAAEAGATILSQGGNAFDAAVAAGFVEAVVAPHNCGIGGYAATGVGFLARAGRAVTLDANAVVPRAATPRSSRSSRRAIPTTTGSPARRTSKARSRWPSPACSAGC